MPNINLDAIDCSILNKLQKNGRLSNVQLAEEVGLSESACLRRVKILEESGIIDRYVMLINQSAIGKPDNVFVMVSAEVSKVAEVMECYLMSGAFDYLLRVITRDNADYVRVHNKLTSLPGVLRVQSSFALRTVLGKTEMPMDVRR
jgi:DNA-binding Lrp family transcriptional regulator